MNEGMNEWALKHHPWREKGTWLYCGGEYCRKVETGVGSHETWLLEEDQAPWTQGLSSPQKEQPVNLFSPKGQAGASGVRQVPFSRSLAGQRRGSGKGERGTQLGLYPQTRYGLDKPLSFPGSPLHHHRIDKEVIHSVLLLCSTGVHLVAGEREGLWAWSTAESGYCNQ